MCPRPLPTRPSPRGLLGPSTNTKLLMSHPHLRQSDWGSCVPSQDLGRLHTKLAAELGFSLCAAWMPCPMLLPLAPVPCLALQVLTPRLGLPCKSRFPRGPPPVYLTPSYFTGPCYWILIPTISKIRTMPGIAPWTPCCPATSLDCLCPPILCLLPAPRLL